MFLVLFMVLKTTSGCSWAMSSSVLAGPEGLRLPCSQLMSVCLLTSMSEAKSVCERPSFSRIALVLGIATMVVRAAFSSFFSMACISFILWTRSLKSSSFIVNPL